MDRSIYEEVLDHTPLDTAGMSEDELMLARSADLLPLNVIGVTGDVNVKLNKKASEAGMREVTYKPVSVQTVVTILEQYYVPLL